PRRHHRERAAAHRHLPRPRIAVLGDLLDGEVALYLLPVHRVFCRPGPRIACQVAVRDGTTHPRIVDTVVRVALGFGVVAEDAEAVRRTGRAGAVAPAHEEEPAGEPFTAGADRHSATGSHRRRLHVDNLVPAAREVGQL